MLHPIRWLLLGVTVIVLAVLGFGAWYVLGGSTPTKPALGACNARPATAAGINGSWKVAPGQNVYLGYRMTEKFAGDVIHKAAVGRTPAVAGTMTIGGGRVIAVQVVGQMRQLTSDRSIRDDYIHTHAIESDTYHTSAFVLTSPISLPSPLHECDALSASARGRLTLHGVTRTIIVPIQAHWDGRTIEVVGTAPIVLADYKIVPPDTSVVKVDDHGSLELSLTFRKSS